MVTQYSVFVLDYAHYISIKYDCPEIHKFIQHLYKCIAFLMIMDVRPLRTNTRSFSLVFPVQSNKQIKNSGDRVFRIMFQSFL